MSDRIHAAGDGGDPTNHARRSRASNRVVPHAAVVTGLHRPAASARRFVELSDRETAIALIGALAGMALNETDHGMSMRYALAAWVIGSFVIVGVMLLFRWIERRIKPSALAIVDRIARSLTPPPPTR